MNKKMLLALFSSVLLTTGCGNNEPAAGGNLANGSNSQVDQHSQSKEIVAANLFGAVVQELKTAINDALFETIEKRNPIFFLRDMNVAFDSGVIAFKAIAEGTKIAVDKDSAAVKFMALCGNSVLSKTQKDFFMSIGTSFGVLSKGKYQLKDLKKPGGMIGCFEGAIEKLKVVRVEIAAEKAAAEKEHLNTIFRGDTLMEALEAAVAVCKELEKMTKLEANSQEENNN